MGVDSLCVSHYSEVTGPDGNDFHQVAVVWTRGAFSALSEDIEQNLQRTFIGCNIETEKEIDLNIIIWYFWFFREYFHQIQKQCEFPIN